jgi:uncharacterized protein HemX
MNLKFNKFSYLLLLILGITIFAQVLTSNKLATSGRQIAEMEDRANLLEDENRKLLAENIEELSLSQLKARAKELGFVEADSVINLSAKSSLAIR